MENNIQYECLLSEVCSNITDGKHGDCKNETDSGYYFVSVKDVYNGKINYENARQIEAKDFEETHKRTKLEANDILVTNTGTIGRMAFIKNDSRVERTTFQKSVAVIKAIESKVIPKYLYYYIINEIERLKGFAGGTTQKNLLLKDLRNFKIKIPNKNIQFKIQSILSTLDDRIELNNEMNKTLEEMAQAIFKSWFVDFEPFKDGEFEESELGITPKGWKVGKIGDFIEINPRTPIQKGETYKFVDMGNVPTNSARVNSILEKEFAGGGARFKNNDVIFARITPCLENGKTAIIDFLNENEVSFGSTEFLIFRGIGWNSMYYSYCLSRYDAFRTYAVQHMNGSSGRQRVSKGDIENYKIVIPPKEILLKYNKYVSSNFEKMKKNDACSNTLRNIRDILLPKLISGEIKL